MLKACGPVVVPIVSWSRQCPYHEITEIIFSPPFSEIVTGGLGGELVIWHLDECENFWPKLMCLGHVGSVKNLGHARSNAALSDSYFFSHSSSNELALWNWENGTCVDIRVDKNYRHTRIKSFQPSFTEARLLFCSGEYPCIVVMHAMQLSNLFTLASNAHPSRIHDFTLFTHAQLKQEVILGIASSGVITVWTLTGKETLNSTNYEHESRMVHTKSPILQIHCCRQLPRLVLLVCVDEWRILDAIDCSTQILGTSDAKQHFVSGDFFHREYVAVYSNVGEACIYRLSKDLFSKMGSGLQANNSKSQLVIRLKVPDTLQLKPPLKCYIQHLFVTKTCKTNLLRLGAHENAIAAFLSVHSDGKICAWSITTDQLVEPNQVPLELYPFLRVSLADIWRKVAAQLPTETGFFHPTVSATDVVTSSIAVYAISATTTSIRTFPPLLIQGTSAGVLIITSPVDSCRFQGHKEAVISILHPFSFTPDRTIFRPTLFLSGGADFAICLWDLETILAENDENEGEIRPLAVFHNHAAPIIALTVGPVTRSSYIAGCVVAVGDDGTVSVVSPNDRYTLLRARTVWGGFANTPATVHAISWRLAEMMLFILAADGSLAVWDFGSGQLERCEDGPSAIEIFNTGSDTFVIGSRRAAPLPLGNSPQANQSASAASVRHNTTPGRMTYRNRAGNQTGHFLPPLMLQRAGANVCGGPAAFVFHIDAEALITNLLSTAVASKNAENTSNIPLSLRDCGNLLKCLISAIYPWPDDVLTETDALMLEALQLKKPPRKRLFGCLSVGGYLSLPIPGPFNSAGRADPAASPPAKVLTTLRLVQVALADALCCMSSDRLAEIFPHSKSVDSLLVNSICSPSSHSSILLHQLTLYSLLARWQAKCLHIRYGARTLTYSLLDALSDDERSRLIGQWLRFLPDADDQSGKQHVKTNSTVDGTPAHRNSIVQWEVGESTSLPTALDCCENPELLKVSIKLEGGIFDSFAFGQSSVLNGSSVHRYRATNCAILTLTAVATRSTLGHLSPPLAARDLCVELDYPSTSVAASLSPHYDPLPPDAKVTTTILQDEVMRQITVALMVYLDYTPPGGSKRPTLVQVASPVRRAAIDFLGRGFPLWEPYVDTAHLLNSLLNLIAGEVGRMPDLLPGEVFDEQQDVARVARQALWRVTFTRPHLVILTLSLMLRRLGPQALNAMLTSNAAFTSAETGSNSQRLMRVVVSSPALAAPLFTESSEKESTGHLGYRLDHKPADQAAGNGQKVDTVLPLVRAASEVLRVLTELSGRRVIELTPILPELVEVVLVCVDRTRLKERGLQAVFPILQRFHSVDSHTRAQKVCVGGTNGMLIFFDFKSGRYYSTSAHHAPVTAVRFNPDGRQLASYAMQENAVRVWQLSSTGLFGIGGQQVRALDTYPIRPLQRPGGSSPAPLDSSEISLVWTEPYVINLLHADVPIRSVTLSN